MSTEGRIPAELWLFPLCTPKRGCRICSGNKMRGEGGECIQCCQFLILRGPGSGLFFFLLGKPQNYSNR